MAWLKVYGVEHRQWPREQKININPKYRVRIAQKLCEKFGIKVPEVYETLRVANSGRATSWFIKLPRPVYKLSLGVIFHEVAHVYNAKVNNAHGHTGTFRRSLIKAYVDGKRLLPQIVREIRAEHLEEEARNRKMMTRQLTLATKKVEAKAKRDTIEFKIQKLQERVKKLDRKIKNLTTRRASANRSLQAYLRQQKLRQSQGTISV